MLKFIPQTIQDKNGKCIKLNVIKKRKCYRLSYTINTSNQFYKNCGNKIFTKEIPKSISVNDETFEVIGLLKAEMSKTFGRPLTFCNSEPLIINRVIDWFNREFCFSHKIWKWYIKININEPTDKYYKRFIENKVTNFWLNNSKIFYKNNYPKTVSYVKYTKNKKLASPDFGTLIIEKRDSIFCQLIINLVERLSSEVPNYSNQQIKCFMRGIIAGEGCIAINLQAKAYRVQIASVNKKDKQLYYDCLKKIGVLSKIYKDDMVAVSKKENHMKLLNYDLVSLHPQKHTKFLDMIRLYGNLH